MANAERYCLWNGDTGEEDWHLLTVSDAAEATASLRSCGAVDDASARINCRLAIMSMLESHLVDRLDALSFERPNFETYD